MERSAELTEGYVLTSYGSNKYLRHVIASVATLRRYDRQRPVALFCTEEQIAELQRCGMDSHFEVLEILPEKRRSIVGVKHHLEDFMVFDCNLFMDSDMIWCKSPDPLWQQFSAFPFTATGTEVADHFFGGPKNIGVVGDIIFNRRAKTLKKFGLTNLPRVQAGIIYAQDKEITARVCEKAREFISRRTETHFRSRLDESGRKYETCEWSLAMAMSSLDLSVYTWLQGDNSAQLDFLNHLTEFDPEFLSVKCHYATDPFVYSLRGIPNERFRNILYKTFTMIPGKGDFKKVTPFTVHFGWLRDKQPFHDFADRKWLELSAISETTSESKEEMSSEIS